MSLTLLKIGPFGILLWSAQTYLTPSVLVFLIDFDVVLKNVRVFFNGVLFVFLSANFTFLSSVIAHIHLK